MFMSQSIDSVNSEIARVYGVSINTVPVRRVYHIYMQYFSNDITLSEAAENIYGVLFDNQLIS